MNRYIDADALEYDTEWSEYHDGFTAYSQMAIDTAPSIDIVRCAECKWYEQPSHQIYENCVRWKNANGILLPIKPDDFCSYGEREGE